VRGYLVTVTYPSARDGLATGAVTSTSDDSDQSNNEDSEPFHITSVDVSVDVRLVSEAPPLNASSGWVGGERRARIDVRNAGPDPADGVALALSLPTDQMTSLSSDPCLSGIGPRCVIGALAKDEVRTFEVPVRMLKPGTALISAEAATTSTDSNPSNDNDAVSVRILQPTIRLLPAVARPGMVPMAFGENMPPGTNVKLRWDMGITTFQGPFRVAADGTMRTPLLIVRHDLLGSRAILATSTRNLFSEINGPMLVANRLSTPPDLRGRG